MTRGRRDSTGAPACALWFAVVLCIFALAAGPAPATNPATNPTQVKQSAIERGLIVRRNNAATRPSTLPTSADARNRADAVSGAGTGAGIGASAGRSVDLKRVAMSLGIVLGVIFIARFALKKLFPAVSVGRNSQVIRVVSRSVIGPKQQFLLVKLGQRLVLVGDSGASMNSLAEITDPSEVAELVGQLQSEATHSSANAFASIFRKAETQFDPEQQETTARAERRELLPDEPDAMPSGDARRREPPDRELVAAVSDLQSLKDRVRSLASRIQGP